MLSSRYATGLGYNPSLWTGTYPVQPPRQNTLADLYEPQSPGFQPPPAPPPPGPSLTNPGGGLLTGSAPEMGQGDGTGDARGAPGPQPGNLSMPSLSYGTMGGTLGTLAGAALGIPGLGLVGGALGTYADVRGLNGQLAEWGLAPAIEYGPSLLSEATFGLSGQSANSQFAGAFTPAVPSSLADFSDLDLSGMTGSGGGAPAGWGGGYGNPGAGDAGFGYGETGDPGGGAPGGSGDYGGIGDSGYGGMDGGYGGNAADGWMRGGYTGAGHDGMVDPYAPAGTVHEGEVVIPAHQVARYGVEPLMALVRGQAPANALAGMMRGPAPTSANALLSQIRYG
jgi:hypothetical protein